MWDARELSQRTKALMTSLNKNEPAASLISQIEAIKKEVVPTEELLRNTKAGLIMGKLRSNSDKDVARAATEVVQRWKKAVEHEKAAKAAKASTSPAPKHASPAPKPSAAGNLRKRFEGDTETRNYKTDGVDVSIATESPIRSNCVGLMYNGLAYRSHESIEIVLTKAKEVEIAMHKAYPGEGKAYKEKVRSLYQNLKSKNNRQLSLDVMSGAITPERFVRMTHKELMSAEQQKKDAALMAENMKKAQVPMAEKSISDSLECSGCKQKKVSYTQAQTRAADEPMTTFCECLNCGKRWKFS